TGTPSWTRPGRSWTPGRASSPASFISFFFQAADGIRDRNVTGVQTCALPILSGGADPFGPLRGGRPAAGDSSRAEPGDAPARRRSEERRVGKECRPGRARLPDRTINWNFRAARKRQGWAANMAGLRTRMTPDT